VQATVIIPALNEKENIARLVPELRKVFSAITDDYEIIIADGGSRDGTEELSSTIGIRFFTSDLKGILKISASRVFRPKRSSI
jgi:glycosyltransferase involved in cell wall biosynthesis